MAGTLFGLSLSQRVDLNGTPAVGWLLYLYQANTSTPVDSYQDTALTVLNPWPIQADAYGMMGQFWLADGTYRARATSNDGSITYFDQLAILAVGASSGAAPPAGVDPAVIFNTGDVMWLDRAGTRTGWVRDNGRTIGSATSGADERANADCQALFEFLWNNFADTLCPVISGRGASSLSDWTANKRITVPDKRGCTVHGLDDMGNAAASRFTDVPIITGGVTTPGSTVGGNRHQLTTAELAAHGHTATVTDPGHTHLEVAVHGILATAAGGGGSVNFIDPNTPTSSSTTGITVANANTGSDAYHNNVARAVVGTWYRKL